MFSEIGFPKGLPNYENAVEAPRASIESFTSATSATSRATAVLSAEKMQQMVEVDALQEAFEDASAKAEKARAIISRHLQLLWVVR